MNKGKMNFGYASTCSPMREADEFIRIEIIDESSRVHVMEVRIGVKDFARAAFGHRGEIDCEFELRRPDLIGSRHEHETRAIPWTKGLNRDTVRSLAIDWSTPGSLSEKVITHFLEAYEIDGWKADRGDLFNMHNYVKGGVKIAFHRHVSADGTPL